MNYFETFEAVAAGRAFSGDGAAPAGFGRAGTAGYTLGALGLFAFLRMFSAVPPGVVSFAALLLTLLALNLLMTALIHLFMDLTGARGSAARLFQAFGWSDYLLALLVPAGIFAKLDLFGSFLACALCFCGVLYARVRLVRRLYGVSANKAVLAVAAPYLGLWAAGMFVFTYFTAWLIWLVV